MKALKGLGVISYIFAIALLTIILSIAVYIVWTIISPAWKFAGMFQKAKPTN